MQNILLGILLISCVVVIISTMFMEPKAEGMGSISGSSANVFGKTASRGKEKLL
ncbi:preprotein translocase subunit SecG, partial [Fusobacterium necrophorum]